MAENENGNPWPDGFSVSWTPSVPRVGLVGVGGTYYWNPGSPTAPSATVTGMWGRGQDVWRVPLGPLGNMNAGAVFLRKGMTSADTLGYGSTSNVSTGFPSVTVNSSIPDQNHIPLPHRAAVSSIEAGLSGSIGASTASTYTMTPQQAADWITNLLHPITPAMGPNDELSPFQRRLQSGQATVGSNGAPPVGYLNSPFQTPNGNVQSPLGDGMGDWKSSVSGISRQSPMQQDWSQERPGGLPGLLWDYFQNR